MKIRFIYNLFAFVALTLLLVGYSAGPAAEQGQGYIGAPGELGVSCGTCHGNPGSYGIVTVDIQAFNNGNPVNTYLPGLSYDIVVTVNNTASNPAGFGFQAVALDGNNDNAGSFSDPGTNVHIVNLSGRDYAEHDGMSASRSFSFKWNAPAPSVGTVNFYAAGNAVNGNGATSGDSGTGTTPGRLSLAPEGALPIELTNFTAKQYFNSVLLSWATETEENSDYFAVQYSKDGFNFETLDEVNAAGNSSTLINYNYRHLNPIEGNNYYRLIEVDFDGQETISEIIVYRIEAIDGDVVHAYPNPIIDKTSLLIRHEGNLNYNTTLRLFNVSGQLIHMEDLVLMPGENTIELDMTNYPQGYYYLKVRGGDLGKKPLKLLKI